MAISEGSRAIFEEKNKDTGSTEMPLHTFLKSLHTYPHLTHKQYLSKQTKPAKIKPKQKTQHKTNKTPPKKTQTNQQQQKNQTQNETNKQ